MTFTIEDDTRWETNRTLKPALGDLDRCSASDVIAKVTGLATSDSGFPPGSLVNDVRIGDAVDLARREVRGHVKFLRCCFLSKLDLADSQFASMVFESCHFHEGANLSGAVIAHRLTLRNCWAERRVDLAGARAARLSLDGSTFVATPGDEKEVALQASIMEVGRSITAEGAIFMGEGSFTGTRVGGEFTLKDAEASRPNGVALCLREVNVARSLHAKRLKVRGRLWLQGAQIGGELNLEGAEIVHRWTRFSTIDALGLRTGRWVNLDDTRICGPVRLAAADIGGKISVRKAVWIGRPTGKADPRSFIAQKLVVARDIEFSEGTQLDGPVVLSGAKIGGSLRFETVNLTGDRALDAAGATVGGNIVWAPNTITPGATIDLRDLTAGRLADRAGAWGGPDQRNLVLSGFSYHSLGAPPAGPSATTDERIRWLRQQTDFDMQPYRVLADALRREGKADDARRVLLTGERDRLQRAELGVASRTWGRVLSVLTGFGYQLSRAVIFLVALFVFGLIYFGANRAALQTESTEGRIGTSLVRAVDECPRDVHPCFSSWEYALNAVIPALPLDQTDTWRARGTVHHVTVTLQIVGWITAGALAAALARLYARPN